MEEVHIHKGNAPVLFLLVPMLKGVGMIFLQLMGLPKTLKKWSIGLPVDGRTFQLHYMFIDLFFLTDFILLLICVLSKN